MRLIRVFLCLLIAATVMLFPMGVNADQPAMSQQDVVSAALLIDAHTGTRMWEKNADTAFSVAGLSKLPAILTLAQSMDDGSLSASGIVCVSENAASVTGPTAFLENTEQIAASELMKAAVMISAGDAITALGETAYGSENVFCDNIGATLKQLGIDRSMTDSFGTSVQLSAGDLSLLGRDACASGTFRKYCVLYLDAIRHSDGRETELVNANRLLNNYAGCTGLMTGSSQTDGYCGVFSASRSGTTLLAVVIGAQSAAARAASAVELLDYGFANFRLTTLAQAGEAFAKDLPVRSGNIKTVSLVARERVDIITCVQEGSLVKKLTVPEYLEAPFDTETSLGGVEYTDASGAVVFSIPLYAAESAVSYGIKDLLARIMRLYIGFSP